MVASAPISWIGASTCPCADSPYPANATIVVVGPIVSWTDPTPSPASGQRWSRISRQCVWQGSGSAHANTYRCPQRRLRSTRHAADSDIPPVARAPGAAHPARESAIGLTWRRPWASGGNVTASPMRCGDDRDHASLPTAPADRAEEPIRASGTIARGTRGGRLLSRRSQTSSE
jgi:hypothetical protein